MSDQLSEKKYTLPYNLRIPKVLDTPIRQIADWKSVKLSVVIQDALSEYVHAHYKEFKKEFEALQKSTSE